MINKHLFRCIDMDKLKALKSYKSDMKYSRGACSYMDPPGYPSYASAYPYEDYLSGRLVIPMDGRFYIVRDIASKEESITLRDWNSLGEWRLRDLWVPPGYWSKRVQAWILAVYTHFNGIWLDKRGGTRGNLNEILQKHQAEYINLPEIDIEDYKKDLYSKYYYAAHYVRKWYPDHELITEFVNDSPNYRGSWWTLLEDQPPASYCNKARIDSCHSPEEVAGLGSFWNHPIGKVCQFCGH